MQKPLAGLAIVLALIGTVSGVLDWVLNQFFLDTVDWEGPLQILADALWLAQGVGLGGAILCLAAAILIQKK